MVVTLLTSTPNPEKTIACAASMCYSSKVDAKTLIDDMSDEQVKKLINHIKKSGHGSVLEHASFTFAIEGVSRALLAEITRHRIGVSFSVRSQRYCSEGECSFVTPKNVIGKQIAEPIDGNEYQFDGSAEQFIRESYEDSLKDYNYLIEHGIAKEDARMVLPNGTCTRMIVTMNVRALLHFFNLRCCTRAQREIRELANEMLKICKEKAPLLFENAGASCSELGYCPEVNSCGRAPTLETLLQVYAHR